MQLLRVMSEITQAIAQHYQERSQFIAMLARLLYEDIYPRDDNRYPHWEDTTDEHMYWENGVERLLEAIEAVYGKQFV